MADTKGIISRRIAGTKARTTERRLKYSPCCNDISYSTFADKIHVYSLARRIYVEIKYTVTTIPAFQDMSSCHDVAIVATSTACDNTLLYVNLAVNDFICETKGNIFRTNEFLGFLFYISEYICCVGVKFINFKRIAGMERQCNHRFNRRQVHFYDAVIISNVSRL